MHLRNQQTWLLAFAALTSIAAAEAPSAQFNLAERKASHWCWQPIRPTVPPAVQNASWARDGLDQFILANLEATNLSPAGPAARTTWLRRVSFDLIGLPPTPEEATAFEHDLSPDAFEQAVDRLLASPHFGERWGRHWLDLVRYAETYGHEFDFPIQNAWRYRDYVIRALNADVPFNQFVIEHVAGDLIPEPRQHPTEGTNESILGTGFWFLGEQVQAPLDVLQHQADRIDNQIDVFGKTFLGLTLSCARCHDHKFDAISTKDVYSLWGFMQSSRFEHATLDPHGKAAEAALKLKALCEQGSVLLKGKVRQAEKARPSANTADDDSVVFETFDQGSFDNWFVTGLAFGDRPTVADQWDSHSRQPRLIRPGLAHSGLLAPRLTGALRSKTFTITHDQIWYCVAGYNARVQLIIDGYRMNEVHALLFNGLNFSVNNEEFRWKSHAGDLRKYLGHRAYIEILDDGDGYVAVDKIVFGKRPPPVEPDEPPKLDVDTHTMAQLNDLATQLDRANDSLSEPTRVLSITDGNRIDQPIYVRGDSKNLGALTPRRFLEAIDGPEQPTIAGPGSGRLGLAQRVIDPSNPLTARVIVNRVWHHLFGRGIVASTDNFGVLGQRPSHPELLDYLAARFMREKWSIKQLIRASVLSSTYRMSSVASTGADQADPQNLLWHRMSVRRLEGEIIRDTILAISGRLEKHQFGPSVTTHLTDFMQGRGRPAIQGPLDGDGRRSIYLEVRRNFLSPMMLAFDFPLPSTSVGTRYVTNVPAQALTLLNDPFVLKQAELWAKRVIADQPSSPEACIKQMYRMAFARSADEEELAATRAFVEGQGTIHGVAPDHLMDDHRAWAKLAHVLFNCKELIFIE